jgi:hypothetical protein
MNLRGVFRYLIDTVLIIVLFVGLINIILFLLPNVTCFVSCVSLAGGEGFINELVHFYQLRYIKRMSEDFLFSFIPNLALFSAMIILVYKSLPVSDKKDNVRTRGVNLLSTIKIRCINGSLALIVGFTLLSIILLIWRLNHLQYCPGLCPVIYRIAYIHSLAMKVVWIQHLIINIFMFGISLPFFILINFSPKITLRHIVETT